MSGQLDVDMINPSKLGVENIVWDNAAKMKDGVYILNSGRGRESILD